MSFQDLPLGEIAESVDYGLTTSAVREIRGPRFLRITDIQDDHVDWNSVPFCTATKDEERNNLLRSGDIVFARTGATTGKSYLIRDCPDRTVFASYLIRVRPSRRVDANYLWNFFRSSGYWSQIWSSARGAAQPGVNATILKALLVPLPPLSEQRRIAAILDQADNLRRKRRDALEQLESVKVQDFETTFLRASFPLGTVADLTASTQYGTSAKAGAAGNYPILRMGNLTYNGEIDLSDLKYIDLSAKEAEIYTAKSGDVLFNRTNSADLVGKSAVFRGDNPLAFAGYLVRWRANKYAEPDYVSGYLNSKRGKVVLRGMAKSIIGMANINAQELKSIRLPIPPLDIQSAFAVRVAEIDKLKASHRAHLAHLDALFASLQHRAFRGEL